MKVLWLVRMGSLTRKLHSTKMEKARKKKLRTEYEGTKSYFFRWKKEDSYSLDFAKIVVII